MGEIHNQTERSSEKGKGQCQESQRNKRSRIRQETRKKREDRYESESSEAWFKTQTRLDQLKDS